MNRPLLLLAAATWLASPPGARAADDDLRDLLDSLIESRTDAPLTIDDRRTASAPSPVGDPDAERLRHSLHGVFRADKADPPLEFRAAPVAIDGLPGAVYFEVARQDSPWSPFRQGVMHAHRYKGALVLRVLDFNGNAGFRDAVAGLWAAPDQFPRVSVESLAPSLDMPVRIGKDPDQDITATTEHPFPTTRAGALEMTSTLCISNRAGLLVFADRGFDADGKQVWGPGPKEELRFVRVEGSTGMPTVQRLDGGLVLIDSVKGEGPGLESGGSLAAHVTFWLTDGTVIENSRGPGRELWRTQVPIPALRIKGLDIGLLGLAKGGRRRLVIPPDLAFGKSGARSVVPPDATLIFDVECLWLQNPALPPSPIAPEGSPPPAEPQPNPAPPPAPK